MFEEWKSTSLQTPVQIVLSGKKSSLKINQLTKHGQRLTLYKPSIFVCVCVVGVYVFDCVIKMKLIAYFLTIVPIFIQMLSIIQDHWNKSEQQVLLVPPE